MAADGHAVVELQRCRRCVFLQQRRVRLLVSLLRLWRVAVMGMVVMGEGVAVVVRRLLASPISSTSSFAHLAFSPTPAVIKL